MKSNFEINLSNKSKFNLSFLVDFGQTKWFNGEEKQDDSFLNKELKEQIPKGQIFEMNSLIFNITKHKKEVLTNYKCFFDEKSNSLSFIISEDICFSDFTKEIMMNLLEFSQKVGIETLYFLVAKKNAQYIRIVQDLMIVGFEIDEKVKTVNIEGNVYKVLMLPIKEELDEIEEILTFKLIFFMDIIYLSSFINIIIIFIIIYINFSLKA